MGLSDIAEGIEVTERQEERGVATVDETDRTLTQRLTPFSDELPCDPSAAATVLERYTAGGSVGDAGRAAGIAPTTAAKALHLLGESVSPVGPMGTEIIQDWIAGHISRHEALELARVGEDAFALAVYVETHDPIEEACAAIEGVLAAQYATGTDALGETAHDSTDFL